MKENPKNTLLVSKVTLDDLKLVEKVSKILRLTRADYIRTTVLQKAIQDLKNNSEGTI